MIRHVCLFRLKRDLSTDAERFLTSNADIGCYRFASNTSRKSQGFGLVLYSEFKSQAALADYVRTPLHDAVAAFMDGFVAETIVADVTSG